MHKSEMHKSLLELLKSKTRDAQTCIFAFLKMILYKHIGYYLVLERRNGWGVSGLLSMPLPAPFIKHGSLQIVIKIT